MEQQNELKQKALKGMLWSTCERFGSLLILFISNIVLARILTPGDYGLIGMLMVFVILSNILVDGGFGNALIQKKALTTDDLSTVFYTNIIVAAGCYAVLFFCSGLIASFYNQPQLSLLLRVVGIMVISDSFGTVQNNYLIKNLNFKRIALIKISAAFISSMTAIILALKGFGVWSLAIQYIFNSALKSLFLWISSNWKPSFAFKKRSFRAMFGFGSKLLLANLLSEGYRNFQVLILGRFFPPKDVGYFTQAKQLQDVPVMTVLTIVNQVTFPVFSKQQDYKRQLVSGLSRCIKTLTFINFPLMVCLVVIAHPLFTLLYTDKWASSVPYFQWLCGGFGLLLVIHNANLNALKAIGKSEIVLYLEIVKKLLGVSMIFLFIYLGYGTISVLWALALNSFIEFFLNGYFTGKYIGYGIVAQAKDVLPNLLIACLAGIVVYFLPYLFSLHYVLLLVAQLVCFALLFFLGAKVCRLSTLEYLRKEIQSRVGRKGCRQGE